MDFLERFLLFLGCDCRNVYLLDAVDVAIRLSPASVHHATCAAAYPIQEFEVIPCSSSLRHGGFCSLGGSGQNWTTARPPPNTAERCQLKARADSFTGRACRHTQRQSARAMPRNLSDGEIGVALVWWPGLLRAPRNGCVHESPQVETSLASSAHEIEKVRVRGHGPVRCVPWATAFMPSRRLRQRAPKN